MKNNLDVKNRNQEAEQRREYILGCLAFAVEEIQRDGYPNLAEQLRGIVANWYLTASNGTNLTKVSYLIRVKTLQ